jgi:DnaK suppressor protein
MRSEFRASLQLQRLSWNSVHSVSVLAHQRLCNEPNRVKTHCSAVTRGYCTMGLASKEIDELRNKLEERAKALREELRDTVLRSDRERAQLLRDEVRDNGDDSFVDLITDLNHAEVARDLDEFRAVRSALTRIESGAYGECVDCGRPIALQRLRAQPHAVRCIECQERHEHLTNATSNTPSL